MPPRSTTALIGLVATATLSVSASAQIRPLDLEMLQGSSDPLVLVSRHYRLVWFTTGIYINGNTLADIDRVCARVKTSINRPLRAPTVAELQTLSYRLYPRQFDPSRAFWDTPERTFFKHLFFPRNPQYITFPARDWELMDGGFYKYHIMRAWRHGGVEFDVAFARSKNEVTFVHGYRLLCVTDFEPTPLQR